MDYEKMPKIDINEIAPSEFKNIFSCKYNAPIITHYMQHNGREIIIGKSSIKIYYKPKTIEWLTFFPFHNIISKEDTIDKLQEEIISTLTLKDIEAIEKEHQEAKEYDIIDQTYDLKTEDKIVPIGFIRNYKRKGIGTLAHTQVIEQIIRMHNDDIKDFKIIHDTANKQRRKQLEAIGLKQSNQVTMYGREMEDTLEEYMKKSADYLKSRGIY